MSNQAHVLSRRSVILNIHVPRDRNSEFRIPNSELCAGAPALTTIITQNGKKVKAYSGKSSERPSVSVKSSTALHTYRRHGRPGRFGSRLAIACGSSSLH